MITGHIFSASAPKDILRFILCGSSARKLRRGHVNLLGGRAFEHFILMEILAYRSYSGKDFEINFWRTKTGLEVDFVLAGGEIAIEVKGASRIDKRDFYSLEALTEEYLPKKSFIVCNEKDKRLHGKIEVMPWSFFMQELWSGNIL